MKLQTNLRLSFQRVKQDILSLKQSLHEWVLHLDFEQKQQEERIARLEAKIQELEMANLDEFSRVE